MADCTLTTRGGSRRRRDRAGVTLDARTRARLEEAAERLIALLDALDGCPDAEPDHDGEAEADEASAQPITLVRDLAPMLHIPRFDA